MKRKMIFGVLAFLLILQVQTAFAGPYDDDFLKEAGKNDFRAMERILERRAKQMNLDYCANRILERRGVSGLSSNNTVPVLELLRKYGFVFGNYMFSTALENRQAENVLIYLIDNSTFNNDTYALSDAFLYRCSDTIIQRLIDKGVKPALNTVRAAIQARNYKWVPTLISLGGSDINTIDNSIKEKELGIELNVTPLMVAANAGNLEIVQLLIANGAKVNLRDEKGRTAASIAYDKGEIEIYNYLKANGAVDFEPRQVAQQPSSPASSSSTTNVYITPPAQNTSPSQSSQAQNTPAAPRLSSGTYTDRLVSGSEINLFVNNNTATATHRINRTNTSSGNGTISGDQLVINWNSGPLNGRRTVYRIDSANQFSAPGETWRMGF